MSRLGGHTAKLTATGHVSYIASTHRFVISNFMLRGAVRMITVTVSTYTQVRNVSGRSEGKGGTGKHPARLSSLRHGNPSWFYDGTGRSAPTLCYAAPKKWNFLLRPMYLFRP